MKKGEKRERHWYIVRKRGGRRICCLLSAFSPEHIKRKAALKDRDVIINKARRWQIVRVFSGAPVFYDYKMNYKVNCFRESVEALVQNEFHTLMDGEKILVKVLS